MWTEYVRLMLIALLLRLDYEAYPPRLTKIAGNEPGSPDHIEDLRRIWADKAVKRYAEAQEKKWQHWNDAMFER